TRRNDAITVEAADGTRHETVIGVQAGNHATLITGDDSGNVTEDGVLPGTPTASGTLSASDVDSSADFVAQTDVATAYGHFSINEVGGAWCRDGKGNPEGDELYTGTRPLPDTIT